MGLIKMFEVIHTQNLKDIFKGPCYPNTRMMSGAKYFVTFIKIVEFKKVFGSIWIFNTFS